MEAAVRWGEGGGGEGGGEGGGGEGGEERGGGEGGGGDGGGEGMVVTGEAWAAVRAAAATEGAVRAVARAAVD